MMKKVVLLLLLSMLTLCACQNTVKVTEEVMQTNEAIETEENAEENVAETEAPEAESEEAVTGKKETITEEKASVEKEAENAKTDSEAKSEADAEVEAEAKVEEATLQPTEEPKEVTEKVTVFEQAKVMYAVSPVNVRRGPSTDYEVVSYLSTAQQVEVTGQAETGWYQMMINEEAAYVSNKYISETKIEVPTPAPMVPQPEPQQAPTTPTPVPVEQTAATPTPQPAQQITVAPAGVIMVGDSRCVQMREAVGGGGCMWICENSKEYTWFVEKAIPNFDKHVGKGTKVVINMGVNDPEHYRQYAETINAKAAEWAQRGATTYLVSVNPVWENPYTTKEQVETFNANVPGMLSGVIWIDSYSWLMENGCRIVDGLHYDAPTSVNIFNFIMSHL